MMRTTSSRHFCHSFCVKMEFRNIPCRRFDHRFFNVDPIQASEESVNKKVSERYIHDE